MSSTYGEMIRLSIFGQSHGAAPEARAMDHQMAAHFDGLAAENFNHGNGGGYPVGILQPQAVDIAEYGTLIHSRHNGENGNKVRVVPCIDLGVLPELPQESGSGTVPLDGARIKILNIQLVPKGICGQPEGSV